MALTKKIALSEEELVNALKRQDTVAVQTLYDMYSAALFGVLSRIVPQTTIAEDLLQEVFVKIWRSAKSYDCSKGRIFTWMCSHGILALSKKFN